METVELNAHPRSKSGKAAARQLRRAGRVPGVFYGPKSGASMIEVDAKEFAQKVSTVEGSHLIRLSSAAAELADRVVLIRDTQYHPVTGAALHADFFEVDLTQQLRVRVPLHFTGKAIGVALGGILQPIHRDIEVECLPTDIPEFIEVDVTPLNIHDTVHMSQLAVQSGVRLCFDTDAAVVAVLPPTVEEVKVVEGVGTEAAAVEGAPAAGAKAES